MTTDAVSPVMRGLTAYIAQAIDADLPAAVAAKAKHHLLDTLASMISGAHLPAGKVAVDYGRSQAGPAEALIAGSSAVVSAVNAAQANGITAHADETDDSHFASRSHLGCAVVPAALAMAEREGCNGQALLKAVVLGYDVGGRFTGAVGGDRFYEAGHSTHSFAPLFGSAAAVGALSGFSEQELRWLLSYTAQQASGVNCWQRDADHIEKGFDFGGMAARNTVAAATMVQAGFTGVDDVFSGERNFFFTYAPDDAKPENLLDKLGERYEVMETNIKKWTVGSPIQAVLDSTQALILEHDLGPDDIAKIIIRMSDKESHVVDNRHMAEINLQHLTSVMVLDRTVSFATAHDDARMETANIQAMKKRIILTPDSSLPRRQPIIDIVTSAGRVLNHRTMAVRGTPENPMDQQEVADKAFDLLSDILGADKATGLIEQVWNIEQVANIRDLRDFMMPKN